MGYRLLGLLQLYRVRFRRRWTYAAGALGVLVGIALFVALPSSGVGAVLSVAFLVLGAVVAVSDGRTLLADARRYEIREGHDEFLAPGNLLLGPYDGFDRVRARDQIYLHSPVVDDLLASTELPATWNDQRFQPPEELWCHAAEILGHRLIDRAIVFNSGKVRLASDMLPAELDGRHPVRLQRTDYFAGEVTNESALRRLVGRTTRTVAFDGAWCFTDNGLLMRLEGSKAANFVGASTLAFTRDGSVITPSQTRRSAMSPNLMAPSGSGSADPADVEVAGSLTLQRCLRNTMERELAEECDLDLERVAVRTRVLGFARLLHRGGKPEFFGASYVPVDASALRIRRSERAFMSHPHCRAVDLQTVPALSASLQRLEVEEGQDFSVPLHASLTVLRHALRRDGDAVLAFLRGEA